MSCTTLFDSQSPPVSDHFALGLIDARPAADPLSDFGRLFDFGFALGLQERDARPPVGLSEILKEAFLDGLAMGFIASDTERRDDYARHLENLSLAAYEESGELTYVMDR